ncbi:MAG: UDP-N-acetylmuramate dehydrogenase [Lachnospiraceae bacterium]|nr:UDP-N-acetylmuramate dehydrogenase [Candidatus Darwinimomas equi]
MLTERYKKLKTVLEEICGADQVYADEPMSRHTTFKAGGPAALYVIPSDEKQLSDVVKSCNAAGVRYYVIGNGSNLLVRDEGFDGVIIEIGKRMSGIDIDGDELTAQAGAALAVIASAARDAGLTGLEFASGIPGNLGGACVMNAGAYDGQMKDVLVSVRLMDRDGEFFEENADGVDLSYRHSNIPERELTVVSAVMKLQKGDKEEISSKMKELNARRTQKQPLEYPSAGSTFKRPEGYFAGKLIQDAGMQGYSVGGAQVSEKHAGFVINKGGATAGDIISLTGEVIRVVREKFGVTLEREIKIL